MNQYTGDQKDRGEKDGQTLVRFIATVGDNVYSNYAEPTDKEIDEILDLFRKRSHLADMQIYPNRGSHDMNYDPNLIFKMH